MRDYRILAIDPGSTSTKVGIFIGGELKKESVEHKKEVLEQFSTVIEQKGMRVEAIRTFLLKNGLDGVKFDATVGRGGLLKPIDGGVYMVDGAMLKDLKEGRYGVHPANLGGILAYEFASLFNCPAFVVDPPTIDEMDSVAKLSGLKEIERKSKFHALNQRATAKKAAELLGKGYRDVNLIVAHMGGGVSVGAHRRGRVVDVNNALDGDGPYSVERSGGLPFGDLLRLVRDGGYSVDELMYKCLKRGGAYSYLGLTDMKKVEVMVENGDEFAKLVVDGFIYQVAKEIGALSSALSGSLDGIVLTGGLAKSRYIVDNLKKRVSFLAPVFVFEGEFEIEALVDGALGALKGEVKIKRYERVE